ncbi:MAG: hypothetical protein IT249_20640 [Chitinophagaceae bacterium]|nr:hypothetical protein [Chitinophagaceae bacterium]
MKKIIVIFFVTFLATGAFAQKGMHRGGGVRVIAPRPVIALGAYSPFYYGYNPYFGYGYPYGYNHMYNRPTKLDLQIADIKNDYSQKIKSARADKSISRSERKQIVRDLKHDRDQEIIETKRNYYKVR